MGVEIADVDLFISPTAWEPIQQIRSVFAVVVAFSPQTTHNRLLLPHICVAFPLKLIGWNDVMTT